MIAHSKLRLELAMLSPKLGAKLIFLKPNYSPFLYLNVQCLLLVVNF
uniref:Uncharacterized protein n=1 Tax=Anguilla anguilla TaxID=7936 RepID=A0A0E9PNA1_ANGAN